MVLRLEPFSSIKQDMVSSLIDDLTIDAYMDIGCMCGLTLAEIFESKWGKSSSLIKKGR
jgi:hypothetical protein